MVNERVIQTSMAQCVVLTNRETVIYLDIGDEKYWLEPCVIEISSEAGGIKFTPLQIFGASPWAEKLKDEHILCNYVPEEEIEKTYKSFISEYLDDLKEVSN